MAASSPYICFCSLLFCRNSAFQPECAARAGSSLDLKNNFPKIKNEVQPKISRKTLIFYDHRAGLIKLLEKTVAKHPLITDKPPPKVLFDESAADSLNFKVRAWTEQGDKSTQIRSDLLIAVREALAENDIVIPTA